MTILSGKLKRNKQFALKRLAAARQAEVFRQNLQASQLPGYRTGYVCKELSRFFLTTGTRIWHFNYFRSKSRLYQISVFLKFYSNYLCGFFLNFVFNPKWLSWDLVLHLDSSDLKEYSIILSLSFSPPPPPSHSVCQWFSILNKNSFGRHNVRSKRRMTIYKQDRSVCLGTLWIMSFSTLTAMCFKITMVVP